MRAPVCQEAVDGGGGGTWGLGRPDTGGVVGDRGKLIGWDED